MNRANRGESATVRGSWFGTLLARLGHSRPWIEGPAQSRPAFDAPDGGPRECAPVAEADLGWLSLSEDAGGGSVHERELTYLGVTPDDIDRHDANGGDLSWISLEQAR